MVKGKEKKEYQAAVDELIKKTEVRTGDLDSKFYILLDQLQQKDKAIEGVRHVSQCLENIEREKIFNWRAYVYTLLRKFDQAAYESLKEDMGGATPKPRGSRTPKANAEAGGFPGIKLDAAPGTNTEAPEFVPGVYWSGSLAGATPTAVMPAVYGFGMPMPMPLPPMPLVGPPPSRTPTNGYGGSPSFNADANGSKRRQNTKKKSGEQQVNSPSLSQLLNLEDDNAPKEPSFKVPAVPPLPGGPLPSPGSANHADGTCKPCAFLHTKGCSNAENCEFCHLCDPEEKKRRKREKRNEMGASPGGTTYSP